MPKNPQKLNTEIGYIKPREIVEEMQESYIDYAMSVIISRALPDVRDGLKPVHRRILYAMYEMGLGHAAKFRKSATVVGECFVKDTLILTEKGLIPIQEIKVGERVYTQNALRKVIQLYAMPPKALLKVTLEDGVSNVVTPSQKFKVLTPDWKFEWKDAKNLTKDDYLVMKADYPEINNLVELNQAEENQPRYLNENIAYLLGIFISEGWISNEYGKKKLPRISIANTNHDIIKKIAYILEQEFGYKATIEEKAYKLINTRGKVLNNKRYLVRINRKNINKFFVFNFDLKNKWALTKEISRQIFVSPKNITFSFINGLIDGDGSIHKNRNVIHYGSISEKLIDQLKIFLLHQGIFTQKYRDNLAKSHYIGGHKVTKRHTFYYLEVKGENATKLASKLSLINKIKNSRVLKLGSKKFTSHERKGWNKYDLIPYAGRIIFRELSNNHIGSGWYQDIYGNKFRMGIKYPDGTKIRYSSDLWEKPIRKMQVVDWGVKAKLEKIGSPLFEFLTHMIENKIYFSRISSIKKVAPEKTYDFEVENDHEFVANGVISHNCMGKLHPHGDAAIYDSLVRMAQDFSLRYPLIQGQGNFASIDDPSEAAAMRYCITGDSLIVTNRCLERIGEISNKEDISLKVLSFGEKVNSASKWFDSGVHPTAKIKTFRGYTLRGSFNHPILILKSNSEGRPIFKWELLSELKEGDFAVIERNNQVLWTRREPSLKKFYPTTKNRRFIVHRLPSQMNPDLAFLMGAILSEGYISYKQSKEKCIGFCNTDKEFINAFKKNFKKVFPDCRVHEFERGPLSYGKQKFTALEIHSTYITEFLENLGMKKAPAFRKQVPEIIFHSTKQSVAAFLRGFTEGDGSIFICQYRNRNIKEKSVEIVLISSSQELLKKLQIILLRFGIDSFLRFEKERNMWRLFIRGHDNFNLFKKQIGFVSKRKKQKLNEFSKLNSDHRIMSKTDFIPFLADYLRKKYKAKKIKWIMKDWLKRHNLDRYPKLRKYYPILKKILEKEDLELVNSFLSQRYLFDKIVLIKTNGKERVYSLRVDSKCHSFVSNGFISHNTEARLSKIGEEMLRDINKNTVDFMDNYDGTRKEPVFLPSPLPQLLLNGSLGIAVGMATNIPPHNLSEVIEASIYLLDHSKAITEDLFKFIKGPDFPTGGQIFGQKEIITAYSQGKGPILMRGRTEVLEKGGRSQIVITEIPFQVQKSSLVEQFANLVAEKKIEGIKDIRDESDREGLRVVIDLQRDAYPQKVLNRLYRFTDLQKTFHLNLLALVEGIQPRVLNLPDILNYFVLHRKEVVTRRTKYDLDKAKERAHILEGLDKALSKIDAVIKTIKSSKDREEAKKNLIKKFRLTEIQATAILEMRLQQLARLERKRIEEELKEKLREIKELIAILKSPQKIKEVVKKELEELKENFGDERRTKVTIQKVGEIAEEDLIPQEETIITLTKGGYIKRINPTFYKIQKRGGRGILGMKTIGEDIVEHFLKAETHDELLFFTDFGKVFKTPVYEIPEGSRVARGRGLLNFLEVSIKDKVLSLIPLGKEDIDLGIKYLVMVTKNGIIKKTALEDFENVRKSGLLAITLKKGDSLKKVGKSTKADELILITKKGQSIHFKGKEVREMGRQAAGVKGIRLKSNDEIVGMEITRSTKHEVRRDEEIKKRNLRNFRLQTSDFLLVVSENGFGKRAVLKEYRLQSRGGAGIKTAKVNPKTGDLITSHLLTGEEEDLIVISQRGQVIRTKISSIPILGRSTQGVRIMKLEEGDKVASATCI